MSNRKLLLADDSITIQKVVNLTFADEGIDVICVGDGNSAMDKFREESPDIVLADVNMPGLNGYEVCENVKNSDSGARIPVILLVGSFEPFDEVEAKRVGADGHLTKPFQSINQLVNTVTVLLDSEVYDDEPGPGVDDTTQEIPDFEVVTAPAFGDSGYDDEMIETDSFQDREDATELRFEVVEDIDTEIASEDTRDAEPEPDTEAAESDYYMGTAGTDDVAEMAEDAEPEAYDVGSGAGQVDPESTALPEEAVSDSVEETDEETAEHIAVGQSAGSGGYHPGEEYMGWSGEAVEAESSDFDQPAAEDEISLDESNLLELDELGMSSEAPHYTPASTDAIELPPSTEAEESTAPKENISPEMVEAISRRVVELLSEGVIKDVARELAPDITDRVVKEIAEEKMNE